MPVWLEIRKESGCGLLPAEGVWRPLAASQTLCLPHPRVGKMPRGRRGRTGAVAVGAAADSFLFASSSARKPAPHRRDLHGWGPDPAPTRKAAHRACTWLTGAARLAGRCAAPFGPHLAAHSGSQEASPVCSCTQRINCSFGTTIRLPTFSTGKPGSCINSYPLDGDTPRTSATSFAFRNSGSSS